MLLDLLFSLMGGNGDPALLIVEIVMVLGIVLFSLSAHEAAHAYAAKKLGDATAYNLGRVSLNPMRHLNPMGFLSMALIGIGWAEPVPINARNFRDPRKGMMLSSLAGPLSNLTIGVAATFFSSLTGFIAKTVPTMTENLFIFGALDLFFSCTAYLNFSLAVFNLIPCPPFDGSRIFFYFLPKKWYWKVMQYERYLGIGVLVLFLVLNRMGLSPVPILAGGLHSLVSRPFNLLFGLFL